MRVTMEDSTKRWTAKRKTAPVIEIIEGARLRWPGPAGPSTFLPPGLRVGLMTRSGEWRILCVRTRSTFASNTRNS